MPYFIGLVLIGMLVVGLFHLLNAFHREGGQLFTVTGKEAVKADKSSKYLVFTNVTTYEVEDSVLFWRWDSSDVYGRLTIGKTYRATLQGWRIPILSMYPNILDPVEVEPAPRPSD
jgi:hypothetical protein